VKWACLAAFAALPLQWYVIATTPVGLLRLHQVAILVFALIVLCRYRPRAARPVWQNAWPFLLANIIMLGLWTVMQVYNQQSPGSFVQEFLYLGVFVAFGLFAFRAVTGKESGAIELLRWAAGAAALSVLIALTYSMIRNGVSPPKVFADAIRTGNPEIVQKQLFKSAFAGFGYDEATVRGNLRHEVFGAVLAAMYVSAWAQRCRPLLGRAQRIMFQLSMLLGGLLLVTSLSRSVILAAAAWPIISIYRSTRTFTLSRRQVVISSVTAVAAMLALASGFAQVLWNRFSTDTSSYQARQGLYQQAFSDVHSHFLTGGVDTVGASSHNFVLDALLRGGIFVAIPAVVVLLCVVLTWLALLMRLHREPDWMVPIVAALVLPIVRLVTSGGGLINPVEWVILGFVAGVLAAHRVAQPTAPSTVASTTSPVTLVGAR
jgi:hypothetical protein